MRRFRERPRPVPRVRLVTGARARSIALERPFQPFHNLIDREARRSLPRRIVLERRQEFPNIGLHRKRDKGVIQEPVVIGVRRDGRALDGSRRR